jgi:predicted RNase H-like HicB family nuclease
MGRGLIKLFTRRRAPNDPPRYVLRYEVEREDDGRYIAEIIDLPGVMVYGATEAEALRAASALALRVFAERIEHGELNPEMSFAFQHV